MTRATWTLQDHMVMCALHAMGDGASEIAQWLEFHESTVKRKMREAGLEPKYPKWDWSSHDDEILRTNYPMWPGFLVAHLIGCTETSLYQRAKRLGVEKHPDHWKNPMGYLWAGFGHPNSIAARIKPGTPPPNKGIKRPGWSPGRMSETQFKKGRAAHEARNYVPIGTEKIDPKRKVLMRKVTDDPTIFPVKRWRPVHVMAWEAEHGPIPAGSVCVFKPGQKTFIAAEITPDRLELVTHAELMSRNTIHNQPAEIRKAMQMRGALNRAINRIEKEQSNG